RGGEGLVREPGVPGGEPPPLPRWRLQHRHRRGGRFVAGHDMKSTGDADELYVSTDVETDGPIPGPHSMLSFASAAYRSDKTLVSTFSANLETLPGASGHPDTMEWWKKNAETWSA